MSYWYEITTAAPPSPADRVCALWPACRSVPLPLRPGVRQIYAAGPHSPPPHAIHENEFDSSAGNFPPKMKRSQRGSFSGLNLDIYYNIS